MAEKRKYKSKRITDFFVTPADNSNLEVPEFSETDNVSLPDESVENEGHADASDSRNGKNDCHGESVKKRKCEPKFQSSWLKTYAWLKLNDNSEMLCELCVKSCKNNPFTTGCKNFRTSTLTRHLDSTDHAQSVKDNVLRANFEQSAHNVVSKIAEKETALVCAMRTMFYIVKRNIALCNYPNMLSMQVENGVDLDDLKVGGNATYSSMATAMDFIDTFDDVISKQIDETIAASDFVTILIDESTDICVQKKLVIYCKTVDKELNTKTFFLGNLKLSDISVTAEVIFNELTTFLQTRGISWAKVIGFGSDGASIMTGRKAGVAARIKQVNPLCISVHCMAHRLNLCTSKAADDVKYMKETFQKTLTDLYYFFSKSTARTEELKSIQAILDSPLVTIKEVHEIRWISFYNSISAVYKSLGALVTYFKKHRKDSSRTESLYSRLTDYTFIATLYMMMDVIPQLAALSMVFQKQDLDIAAVQPAIGGVYAAIEAAKSGKSYYQRLLEMSHTKIKDGKLTVNGISVTNSSTSGKTVKASKEEFVKSRDSFLCKLSEQLGKRFPEQSTQVSTSFHVLGLRPITFLSKEDLQSYGIQELDIILEHFGKTKDLQEVQEQVCVDPDATRSEWAIVKGVVIQNYYPRDKTVTLWKILKKHHSEQFPNLVKLVQISLHVPLQTADCERGFSAQNHMHTNIRNKLDPQMVNKLMTIQLEGGSSTSFNFKKAVSVWKAKRDRRLYKK